MTTKLRMAVLEVLEELGYYSENLPATLTQKFHQVPYDGNTLVGLFVHSLLSQHPRQDWYTNGESIWYPGKPTLSLTNEEKDIRNALKEYVVMRIIDGHPGHTSYDKINGDLRIAEFSTSFSKEETEYDVQMKKLLPGREELIEYERHLIKTVRLPEHKDILLPFLSACHKENATQELAQIVTKNLAPYQD